MWKEEGMELTRDRFYCGKKVAYVYRASKEIRGTKIRLVNMRDRELDSLKVEMEQHLLTSYRVIWGKITRT